MFRRFHFHGVTVCEWFHDRGEQSADIARLALREMVDIIVLVSGDSDLVPAFRLARREGVRGVLDHMGHGVRRELKAHADIVM